MQNFLRVADTPFAERPERSSPLPFDALPIFSLSHDLPTLTVIQNVFEYILCRPPIIIVRLATAVLQARKDEAFHIEEET